MRVAAVNSLGIGPLTAPQAATPVASATPLPRVPSAPRNLTLEASSGRIAASWIPPSDAGLPALHGYVVQFRAGQDAPWLNWPHDGTGNRRSHHRSGKRAELPCAGGCGQ